MSEHETPRNEASAAVVTLRKALGMTQQRFAVEVLKTAITTVARYETSHPPRGEALLRLAKVAAKSPESYLAGEFYELYLQEVVAELPFDFFRARAIKTRPNRGFLIEKLTGDEELNAAEEFVNKLQKMRGAAARKDHLIRLGKTKEAEIAKENR